MDIYIALLRGINVGGNNSLPMKGLSALLTDLGCTHIQTYIQSGNVVFKHNPVALASLATKITEAISKTYGFEPQVMLLKATDLHAAIRANPYPTDEGKFLHFYFLANRSKQADIEKLNALKAESEEYSLINQVFYLYAPNGVGRSKLAAGAEKALKVPVTARNWNTVKKLQEMILN
ncbi:DUF1697 domain-containing protein [Reinekea sp.]|jgi:uncharacterized protein (DUF1697 family)|uniref:DUF1697 domain-containing protein n=1 Tax=Reinekea sp. TaxID=1970455 RepID=UPI00398A2872